MQLKIKSFPKLACHNCGSDCKLIDTIIDGNFVGINEVSPSNLTVLLLNLDIPVRIGELCVVKQDRYVAFDRLYIKLNGDRN